MFIFFLQKSRISQDAISYTESVLEAIMGGFEGLINILDSDGGFGSLEYKVNCVSYA
jgi:NCK-associated protein 1